jgi:hypothetical protein
MVESTLKAAAVSDDDDLWSDGEDDNLADPKATFSSKPAAGTGEAATEEVKEEVDPTAPKTKNIQWYFGDDFTIERNADGNKVLKQDDYIEIVLGETLG